MKTEALEDLLFPGLRLMVRPVVAVDDTLVIDAAGCGPPGRWPQCPQCERPATRVRSRYRRRIVDRRKPTHTEMDDHRVPADGQPGMTRHQAQCRCFTGLRVGVV